MKVFPTIAAAVTLAVCCGGIDAQSGKPSVNKPVAAASSAKADAALGIVAGFGIAPGAWTGHHAWPGESRNRYGDFFGAPSSCAPESPLAGCDGNPDNYGYPQPQVTLGQGINNYALSAPRRYCAQQGYYPSVSECPQGWLYIMPEPLR